MRVFAGFAAVGLIASGWAVTGSFAMAQGGGSDAELEALCRAGEAAIPDSCPCTITAARRANVSDAAMRSLFADDGHANPVGEQSYAAFWNAKVECLASTTMASMGLAGGSVPMPMTPPAGVAAPQANRAPQASSDQDTGYPWGLRQTEVVQMTPARARDALAKLKGTKWTGDTLATNPPRSIETTMNFREDGLLVVSYRDPVGGQSTSAVYSVEVDDTDPNRMRDEGRSLGYNGVRIGPNGDGVRARGRLARFPIKLTDLRSDYEAFERLMIDYRGGDELVLGEYGRQGYLNSTFTKAGAADEVLSRDLMNTASASALHKIRVASAVGAGREPALPDRFATMPSELLGDAGCSDDLVLIPSATAMPRTMKAMLDRTQNRGRRQIAVGYWGANSGASAYKVSFDGRERILAETSSDTPGMRRFSDGTLSMIWQPIGAPVSDGAFGFTPLEVTVLFKGEEAKVRALQFGGC